MSTNLSSGDMVLWRGSFGASRPIPARVTCITYTSPSDPKGESAKDEDSVPWARVKNRDVVVSLSNGHWAYASQISPLPQLPCETCGGLPCLEGCR
jgi:hypothetical protein